MREHIRSMTWLVGPAVWLLLGCLQAVAREEPHAGRDEARAANPSHGDGPAIQIDHVILAIDDLETGMRAFEQRTGIAPVYGGSHPDRDTHNAIVPLSGGTYVEILAPKDGLDATPPFFEDLDRLTLVGFALSARDIDRVESTVRTLRLATDGTEPGSRTTPDGGKLAWRLLLIDEPDLFMNPFFIAWSDGSEHPSEVHPPRGELENLTLTTPRKAQIERILAANGGEVRALTMVEGARALTLAIDTPKGRITFSSAPGSSERAATTRGGHPSGVPGLEDRSYNQDPLRPPAAQRRSRP